ncbi:MULTISPECIES: hypothetical protein [unclassified Streptomyces]|uniref:hypothetical protein n=1 Tax=unclassified Streptomyces TaxID=2593676 RepID=UPI0033BE6415
MADERYQWLDEEAAERLLRGDPVDPVGPADDLARPRAGRLAEALDAIRAPVAEDGLPGEAAALAAFREATAARAAASAAGSASGSVPGSTADLGRVRLARPVAAPRRWGRSARYGLAAAVAAVAVGGVAVAAGTGALPLVGPAPARSVSAGDTARPLVSPEPDGTREDPGIPGPPPPVDGRTPDATPSAGTGSTAPAAPDGEGANRPKRDAPEPGRSTADPHGTPRPDRTDDRDRDGNENGGGTDLRERAVEACRAYRSGKLDDGRRRLLTETLRNGETLRRYCDRLLAGAPGDTSGDGAKDGSDSGSGDGSGNRRGDGSVGGPKGDGRGDGKGGSRGDGSRGRGRDGRGTPRTSAETLAGPASTDPAELPGTGATTRLPLAV